MFLAKPNDLQVYKLQNLEILDLNKNRLHRVPEEIKDLKALRLLAVMNNNLETIPFCMGHMDNLKVVKLGNNPLKDGLREIIDNVDVSPSPRTAGLKESSNERDVIITTKMKKFLLDEAASLESGGDSRLVTCFVNSLVVLLTINSSESPLDTPRPPRRTNSVRFPVVPSASGSESAPDLRSPLFPKPSIPVRTHYRIASGQNSLLQTATQRRPGVTPLIIGNERNRSNSESVLQATHNLRIKRMGIVPRKPSDLSILEEPQPRRSSVHFRGLSHGSVLKERQNHSVAQGSGSSLSQSPSDNDPQRGVFVRRLSSLPENKRQSKPPSQVIDGAKSILYSLHQIHPQMSVLINSLKNGMSKKSGLERIYHSTKIYIEQLDSELHDVDITEGLNNEARVRALKNISTRSQTCIRSYQHVCNLLLQYSQQLATTVDQRYVRTLFLLVYGSLVEAQIACVTTRSRQKHKREPSQDIDKPTISVTHEDSTSSSHRSITPTRARPMPFKSLRKETSIQSIRSNHHNHYNPTNTPQSAVPLYINGRSRSNSRTNTLTTSSVSSLANTPRSGESFLVPETPIESPEHDDRSYQYSLETQQDMLFERVYLALSESLDAGLRSVPKVAQQAKICYSDAKAKYAGRRIIELLTWLNTACRTYLEVCDMLKARLQSVKLKEPEVRNSPDFWKIVGHYLNSFGKFADILKKVDAQNLIPHETIRAILPVHRLVKGALRTIHYSPWYHFINPSSASSQQSNSSQMPQAWEEPRRGGGSNYPQRFKVTHDHSRGGSSSSNSLYAPSVPPTPIPATPLFAALGPAAQATIPNTPLFSGPMDGSIEEVYQRSSSPASSAQSSAHSTMLYRR